MTRDPVKEIEEVVLDDWIGKSIFNAFFLCGYIQKGRTYIYIVKECQFAY